MIPETASTNIYITPVVVMAFVAAIAVGFFALGYIVRGIGA